MEKHSFGLRLTTRHLLLIFPIALLFVMALEKVHDTDVWWHLKAGEWMLAQRAIPRVGLWSWLGENRPWVAHEWLFEVCAAIVYRVGGLLGLILAKATLVALAFSLVLRHALRRCGSPGLAALVTLIAGVLTLPFWSERPQMFSYVLSAYFFFTLDAWQRGERWHLWILPPLMLVWVNFHGAYIFAYFLFVAYILSEAVMLLWARWRGTAGDWSRLRHLVAVIGVSLLLSLFNPHGAEILFYPFQYMGNSPLTRFVVEWFSPDFHDRILQLFALYLLATFAVLAVSPRRPRPVHLIITVLLSLMALMAQRNIPLAVIGLAPILAEHLRVLGDAALAARASQPEPAPQTGQLYAINWLLVALIPLLIAVRIPHGAREGDLVRVKGYPVGAIRYLESHPLPGRMFNFYDWGGYLIWKRAPRYQVGVDGRADIYGNAIMSEYTAVQNAKPNWARVLDKYRVDWILWRPKDPFAQVLTLSPRWRQVYRDRDAVIFVRQPHS